MTDVEREEILYVVVVTLFVRVKFVSVRYSFEYLFVLLSLLVFLSSLSLESK